MQTDNTLQIGVVMTVPGAKPVMVWVYSEYAAPESQWILMKLLRQHRCRLDPEEFLSKLILEMIEFHVTRNLSSDKLRFGVKMYVDINQMYVIDPLGDMIRSTNMTNRTGNFKLTISEYLSDFEKRAEL